jgi:mono/diheme cytochrome c family protein
MQLRRLKFLAGSAILTLFVAACSTKSNTGDTPITDPVRDLSATAGKAIYEKYCLACHLATGKGAPPMNPPLTGTSFVLGDKSELIAIVTNGMAGAAVDGIKYKNVMPGFAFLTDEEIADVLTYIRSSFGNHADQITATEVAQLRPTK